MSLPKFTGSFTQQEPIPEAAIAVACEVMRTGRLHRYNTDAGEMSEVARLELDYAAWQGSAFCLAVASGGQAMQIALRASGVTPGTPVLTNSFTLAPVPGAIAAVGGLPVLVEITPDLVLDLEDLVEKAASSGAVHLLVSHMRGHLCDMDALTRLCAAHGITLIEDCAHTMGASWNGTRSGNFGIAGCFSTQTYKHMNSGEGGFLTSDDPDFMARAIILSGSYMLFDRHAAAPAPEVFARIRLEMPNMSARMDNLRAALLRRQLAEIETACARWNALHDRIADALGTAHRFVMPHRSEAESYVASSLQFRLPGVGAEAASQFLAKMAARGVELKWFGRAYPVGFTSAHQSWAYVALQALPGTDAILSNLFDMRLPLTFSLEDCDLIVAHLMEVVAEMTEPA